MQLTPARLRAFLRDIEKGAGEDGCWLWRGQTNGNGYGGIGNGLVAHRVAYEWLVGPIPEGMELDHICRTRGCVNPHHLEPVTHAENLRRAKEIGPRPLRRYCRNGHPQTPDSVRIWGCRLCSNDRAARRGVLRHAG